MKKKLMLLALVLVILCAAAGGTAYASGIFNLGGRQQTVTIPKEEYERLQRFAEMDEILQYLESWYIEEPDVDKCIEYATEAMFLALDDPYSYYYNEESWTDMWEDDEGEYAGVGLYLSGNYTTDLVTVTRVFKNTPAKDAGVMRGDILVRVEEIEVNAHTMQEAVDVMRGTVGEPVEIEVKRGEEYLTFSVVRAIINVNRVESCMLDNDVGYIALYEFAGECAEEFAKALTHLEENGAKALVVDLRDNPGGWVDAAVDTADLFLDADTVVYAQDRYGNKEVYSSKDGKDDIPLVLLVNENSASSSEILAGSLQDLHRATVVGKLTYGKGIMQTVIPLNDNKTGFQFTIEQYYLPSGTKVHKVGITPDIECEMPEELQSAYFEVGDMTDPQLQCAWETAVSLLEK